MSTRFDLEYPYTIKWKIGYFVINGENRKHVMLLGDNPRSTTSYARYLMSVHLGRFLESYEQVDHIDHDKTNDVLENLQILSISENNIKESLYKGRLMSELICPECSMHFMKRKGHTQAVDSLKGKITCCSIKCGNLFKTKNISKKDREIISRNTLLRVFRSHE